MKKYNPHVSIIMSVYNGERYILRCLMSILSQEYRDFEIVLIDDGSTDLTWELISKVSDDRLKCIRHDNVGLTKSLNKALEMASGNWIARHDADDFSISSRLSRQISFLEKNPTVGMLGSSCFIQPERHGIINEVYKYPETHCDIVAAFCSYNPFVHGSMVIRRDLIEEQGGYNETYRYVQDYELWSRILGKTKSHNLSEPLYVRSVHQQASETLVDKEPIFKEIRDTYIANCAEEVLFEGDEKVPIIKSKSLYPWITLKEGWNKSIAKTYFRMSLEARKQNLPWGRLFVQSFFHSPFFM